MFKLFLIIDCVGRQLGVVYFIVGVLGIAKRTSNGAIVHRDGNIRVRGERSCPRECQRLADLEQFPRLKSTALQRFRRAYASMCPASARSGVSATQQEERREFDWWALDRHTHSIHSQA